MDLDAPKRCDLCGRPAWKSHGGMGGGLTPDHEENCIHRGGRDCRIAATGYAASRADLIAALERAEKAERERDEARRDFFKVAEAIGMVNYPEGQAPWPASADKIAEAVQRDRDEDRAEVERMRPVVVEAVRWCLPEECEDSSRLDMAIARLLGCRADVIDWDERDRRCRQYIKEHEQC